MVLGGRGDEEGKRGEGRVGRVEKRGKGLTSYTDVGDKSIHVTAQHMGQLKKVPSAVASFTTTQ